MIERRISKVKKLQKEAEEKAGEEMEHILKEIGADSMKSLNDRKVGETYYEMKERLVKEEEQKREEESKLCIMLKERREQIERELYGESRPGGSSVNAAGWGFTTRNQCNPK